MEGDGVAVTADGKTATSNQGRVSDSYTQTFNTWIELFENATIDLKNLEYIWNELEF